MQTSTLYDSNLRLSQVEYRLQHIHLRSQPRCLGLVLSNRCNIGCIHCYQSKNGDSLLHPMKIGQELRREFMGFYPYLSTLRLQGGELFAISGFRELLDDVAATVDRPILSISTNGTMIDEEWAERIVRTPFQNVTVSIDGATPDTYAKLRRGGRLETVLQNVGRIRRWKEKLGSRYPFLDSFFVIMRSNFREIPKYFELMREYGFTDLSLQTMELTPQNTSRFPTLEQDESVSSPAEVTELYRLLRAAFERDRKHFRLIRISGLTTLFAANGLDGSFLEEGSNGLYPDSDDLVDSGAPAFELCPNPWTTLFVVENGDVHLCFLSEPIGNLYQAPLAEIWNCPRAVAKRSQMSAGRYMASGCSSQWCSWREGKSATLPGSAETKALLVELKGLRDKALEPAPAEPVQAPELAPVRRMLVSRERRIAELEVMFKELCDTNQSAHEKGQAYINELEGRLESYEGSPLVRAARKAAGVWGKVERRLSRP